jgi:hypothetical protein
VRPADPSEKHLVPIVLEYEEAADSWSQNKKESLPVFIPLSKKHIARKMRAITMYETQLRSFPNLRSPGH